LSKFDNLSRNGWIAVEASGDRQNIINDSDWYADLFGFS
jgi:hypothetical protein